MFTHLHVHSDNSVLDGYGTIDEYINKAKEYNQNALALTDHNTLTGIYTFINKCRKQGIKGIAGCEINLAPNNNAKLKEYIQYGNNKYVLNNGVNTHLTLLAKNHNGLLNLFQIIYHSYKSENFFNVPRIDLNILKQFSKDLICLSGCPNSEINIRLRMNDIEKAENEALQLKEIFGQDFYIEIMSMRGEPNYNIEKLIDLALKLKIQPVLTNDIHYANKSDSNIHEKILAIGRKAKMEETPTTMGGLRYKFADNEYYFKRIICYKILFRETDTIIKTAEWFNSYKANIVAYSLSKLIDIIKKRYKDKSINFKAIWQNQNISLALRKQLEKLTKFTHDFLIDDSREVQNVTEWAKRPNCWLRFESIQFPLDVEFVSELVSNSEIIEEKVSAKKLQKELNLDRAMIELYKIKSSVWINLQKWNVVHKVLSPTESDLIRVATKINTNYFPTEKQCVRILQVLERARDEGFPE